MKTNTTVEKNGKKGSGSPFRKACAHSCKRLLAQITKTREAVLAEARDTLKVQDRLLQLALNEAEALSWQTSYPQLVFPALAVEKVRGVVEWTHRQGLLVGNPNR